MALFVLRRLTLQMRMRSHPAGLDVWRFVWTFVYFRTSCVRTAKALARLRGCTGSPEPSLVVYWAGSNISVAFNLNGYGFILLWKSVCVKTNYRYFGVQNSRFSLVFVTYAIGLRRTQTLKYLVTKGYYWLESNKISYTVFFLNILSSVFRNLLRPEMAWICLFEKTR